MTDKNYPGTQVVHAADGNNHLVALSALRVLLLQDSVGWFAQGLEVDYAASGATIDEAKKNFEDGFCKTLNEHLVLHGKIDRFLKIADQSAWEEFYQMPPSAVHQSFSCVHIFDVAAKAIKPENVTLPFDRIAFISRDSQELMAA